MPKHLQREIESLKKKLLHLSTIVEEHVLRAVRSVEKKDETMARNVFEQDVIVDKVEIEVEEECLKRPCLAPARCRGSQVHRGGA